MKRISVKQTADVYQKNKVICDQGILTAMQCSAQAQLESCEEQIEDAVCEAELETIGYMLKLNKKVIGEIKRALEKELNKIYLHIVINREGWQAFWQKYLEVE